MYQIQDMSRVLIIGAGGVGRVVTHKCAQLPDFFSEICLASRTQSKCEQIASELNRPIQTAALNADEVKQTVGLINQFKPNLVINVALPYQDLAKTGKVFPGMLHVRRAMK